MDLTSILAGIIVILGYLVYVFKGKADKANTSTLLADIHGQDTILKKQQDAFEKQKADLDSQITSIEDRIKARDNK